MNNTIKYSKATNVSIIISCCEKNIELQIKDNGVGFDMSGAANGIGLSNINNRVKQFNGKATIKSAPGKGCSVAVCMPVLE